MKTRLACQRSTGRSPELLPHIDIMSMDVMSTFLHPLLWASRSCLVSQPDFFWLSILPDITAMSNARSMKRLNGIAKSAPSLCFAQQDALPTQSQIIARFCSQWTSRRTSLELPRQKPCPSRRLSATRQLSSSSPSFRPIQHGGTAPTTLEAHNREVASIAARVRDFYDRKEKFRIAHGSTNSTRKNSKDPKKLVDTSRLNHVVKVDTVNKTALVEPK